MSDDERAEAAAKLLDLDPRATHERLHQGWAATRTLARHHRSAKLDENGYLLWSISEELAALYLLLAERLPDVVPWGKKALAEVEALRVLERTRAGVAADEPEPEPAWRTGPIPPPRHAIGPDHPRVVHANTPNHLFDEPCEAAPGDRIEGWCWTAYQLDLIREHRR